MKKVLIAGSASYIGTSLEKWLARRDGAYAVDTIDLRDSLWRGHDFSKYDSVFHVAGIVHLKEKKSSAALYYAVNRDLSVEVAQKAKREGVRQFIFMSSMSVYPLAIQAIGHDTPVSPASHYGMSKLEAEKLLSDLIGDSFHVAILRPPMVYGPGCPGNYARLSRLARRLPCAPRCENKRSMLFIDHLSEAVRLIIDSGEGGLFFPQDRELVDTGVLMALIARANGKKCPLIPGFSWLFRILGRLPGPANKVFGDHHYHVDLSQKPDGYRPNTLSQAVLLTEREIRS